jgi:hypothetical protein
MKETVLAFAIVLTACVQHPRSADPIALDLPTPEPCFKNSPSLWTDSVPIADSSLMRIVSGEPIRYPPRMLIAGRSGRVRARFVIDTLGQVSPGSILIEAYSDKEFVPWVCDYWRQQRMAPILVGGRKGVVGFIHVRVDFKIASVH